MAAGGFFPVADARLPVTLLDDLSGHEFEDAVAALFRAHGYEDVAVADRVADEGRDVTMRDGDVAYVVECKHTATVSRPVVQKTHSAAATYDHDGPRRGMVATSGRFTAPAEAYAEELRECGDPHPVELIDGNDLRELGEAVGMDLYNGRIEIVCEETLPVGDPELAVAAAFEDVTNAPPRAELPTPDAEVVYRPVVDVEAVTRAIFETSVGVVHRIDRRDRFAVRADRDGPSVADDDLVGLLDVGTVELSAARAEHGGEARRFGRTEAEYRDVAREQLCDALETTVTYTGDNNVTYDRECRPSPDDVSLQRVRPLYVPRVEATVELGEYGHGLSYDAAGPKRALRNDEVRRCVHCGESGDDETHTYCENCGSISCESHTETERLVDEPVCTGCSVTAEFFYAEKHFFDEDNAATFREAYAEMPFYRKAMENPALAAGVVAAVAVVLLVAAVAAL
jgi:restriction endonuclease Mrr